MYFVFAYFAEVPQIFYVAENMPFLLAKNNTFLSVLQKELILGLRIHGKTYSWKYTTPPPSHLRYATPPFQLTLVRVNNLQPPPTAPILPTGNVMTGVVVVVAYLW